MLNDGANFEQLPYRGERMVFDQTNPSTRMKTPDAEYVSSFTEAVKYFTGQKRTPLTHEERMQLINAPLPSVTLASRSRGHAHGHGSNPETSDGMYSNAAMRRGDW